MDKKIVFIGSEAEGYYSGAYALEGGFVSEDVFNQFSEVFNILFENRSFHELDGKHSEVEGTQVIEHLDNMDQVARFSSKVTNYDSYLIEDFILDHDLEDDAVDLIMDNVESLNKRISDLINNYVEVSFYLTKENAEKVNTFVEELDRK